jgi:hypothetical protein
MRRATARGFTRPRRLLATGLVATALLLGVVPGLPSADSAAAAEPCVSVIVDARLLGGDVRTGCAKGDPGSGLEALTAAGFSYAFVPRQPGLVCQVDGLPECSRTSTTTYWSYWYRAKGSARWVYANQGAGAHDPQPCSTEAWVWQEGGRREPPDISIDDGCAPGAAPARSERPTTSKPATTADAAPAPTPTRRDQAPAKAGGSGRTSDQPSPASPPATSAMATGATASTAPTSAPAAPTGSASEPTATPVAARSAATGADGSGSGPGGWLGLALAAALVTALGGAAVLRARRGGGP